MKYELKFDPKTIEHLGVKMYSTLPPALAELISNAYDADASKVEVIFNEKNGTPVSIVVKDNGSGMTSEEIQNKFLVIGRNRRSETGDTPSPKFGRLPTGKKGLGKLALFGLASKITFNTTKDNRTNRFFLDWEELLKSDNTYNPSSDVDDKPNDAPSGSSIKLSGLKRKSPFDLDNIARSLSRIFITDSDFQIILRKNDKLISVSNELRIDQIDIEFEWDEKNSELSISSDYNGLSFKIYTAKTPIAPITGLRGISIFSRGKLVNKPEFFSDSTSSFFHQYLTGFIQADFIDLLNEDVISTNRQSINWDNEEMIEFRLYLQDLLSQINKSWREKRKISKERKIKNETGIDKERWIETLPNTVKQSVSQILNTMIDDEGNSSSFNPVLKALHEIVPEYPMLHWRNLHHEIKVVAEPGYKSANYYTAFHEASKRYANKVREYSGSNLPDLDAMGKAFNPKDCQLSVSAGYLKKNGTEFLKETLTNIQDAQMRLSQGVIIGGRNIVAHEEITDLNSSTIFSEKDCLDLLSLISHLMTRIESAKIRSES